MFSQVCVHPRGWGGGGVGGTAVPGSFPGLWSQVPSQGEVVPQSQLGGGGSQSWRGRTPVLARSYPNPGQGQGVPLPRIGVPQSQDRTGVPLFPARTGVPPPPPPMTEKQSAYFLRGGRYALFRSRRRNFLSFQYFHHWC